MPDAICRWRNPYINTVRELINILPKTELTKPQARDIVITNSPYNFYRTPYQLACQLGLYHETSNFYYPKFKHTPTDEELELYLKNWIIHYTVPNPYTRSLPSTLEPFSIHARICEKLFEEKENLSWSSTLLDLFGFEIGNKDILKNSFRYSPVLNIIGDQIILKDGVSYDDLASFINIDISSERLNKEYFFDLFNVHKSHDLLSEASSTEIITTITNTERDLIHQLETSSTYTQTEKNQIIKARIGQGLFRRRLIAEYPICPITLVDDIHLLVASHIKPWRFSNNTERLDPQNGLLLTPTYDKLFDKGYISFRQDKTMMVSSKITSSNITRLGLTPDIEITNLPINGRETYFDYHRLNIFQT